MAMTATAQVLGCLTAALLGTAAGAQTQTTNTGAAVFEKQKCALCHALGGRGNAKGPLDGVGAKLSADDIRKWIVTPAEMTAASKATRKPAMRAYPNLPQEDLDAIVAFLAAKKTK